MANDLNNPDTNPQDQPEKPLDLNNDGKLDLIKEPHDSGIKATLPFGFDSISGRRELSSTSLAALFPLISSEIELPPGFPFGAIPGVGKSYFAKLQALERSSDLSESIVIEPEKPQD